MIACALVGPIPGRTSSSSAVAVLILTVCPGVNLPELEPVGEGGLLAVVSSLGIVFFVAVDAVSAPAAELVALELVLFFALLLELFLAVVVEPKVILSWIAST